MTIQNLYAKFRHCSGISIDSRTTNKNQMFFALKGPNFDGHKYIDSAFLSGAKYAIIQDDRYSHIDNTILVKDTEKTLQDLARFHRIKLIIPIIGLTGSNGKTTTKELLASVLSQKFNVFATKGNYNNHLGVPISILSIQKEHEIAIIEMGANHIGEIKFLCEISMPNYGLITNVGKAHLEGFGSVEGVRIGKTELYDYLRKVNGLIFYNRSDVKLLESILEHDNSIVYNTSNAIILNSFPNLQISYNNTLYNVNLSGAYNAANMIAAITIGEYFKIDDENIKKGLSKYTPTNNRSEVKISDNNMLIMDAYNANPSSMKVSIDNLYHAQTYNKVLIIGHMLELGQESQNEHQELVNHISTLDFDSVYLVGHEFNKIDIPTLFYYFENTTDLCSHLANDPLKNKTILLKGSRGVALEKITPYL